MFGSTWADTNFGELVPIVPASDEPAPCLFAVLPMENPLHRGAACPANTGRGSIYQCVLANGVRHRENQFEFGPKLPIALTKKAATALAFTSTIPY